METCLLKQESDDVYNANRKSYLTSHYLIEFINCPKVYIDMVEGTYTRPDSSAFLTGRALHTLTLEGETKFHAHYTSESPINKTTGKPYGPMTQAFKNWAEAKKQEEGLEVIAPAQHELVLEMHKSITKHQVAQELLQNAPHRECVTRTLLHDIPCQIKTDAYGHEIGIIDLKTCDNIDFFRHDAVKYNYFPQMAFYRSVMLTELKQHIACTKSGLICNVHLIAVEKKYPFRCGAWQMNIADLMSAAREISEAITELKECMAKQHFPTRYEQKRLLGFGWSHDDQ